MAVRQPLTRQLPGAPDLLALHARHPQRYPFLLATTSPASGTPQFDILFACPGATLTLDASGELQARGLPVEGSDFLDSLGNWWQREARPVLPDTALPFAGGWFVFLGYELAGQVEPWLDLPVDDGPVATAVRVPAALVRDCVTGRTTIVTEAGSAGLLDAIAADVRALPAACDTASTRKPLLEGPVLEEDADRFIDAVRRVQQHIAAGDVYQANISRRWSGRLAPGVEPWQVFERLRQANPAPFAGLAVLGDLAVVSSSPERLLRIRGRRVETRPIAGTRPRHVQASDDAALRAFLLASTKERAEHVMLIDLERNDLGKVCEAGSVKVEDFMSLESYAHVHHIVSGVVGTLRPGVRPTDALRAVFPGGTITGCPKPRCMEIIRDIEGHPRGAYTGAMGYIGIDGSADFNILIRTVALRGQELAVHAGCGVVADSTPEHELAETRAKARGVLLGLGADRDTG